MTSPSQLKLDLISLKVDYEIQHAYISSTLTRVELDAFDKHQMNQVLTSIQKQINKLALMIANID